jgi:hypothetical protein
MAPVNPTDKPLFSFKEVVYIAMLVSGFLFQQFNFKTEIQILKTEIHDAIIEQSFSKKESEQRIFLVEKKADDLEKKYNTLMASVFSPAAKPKKIKIESE